MSQLDQYAISRILGSTISPIARQAFGALSVVHATGGAIAARPGAFRPLTKKLERDKAIVGAFTAVHRGYSVDRVLCDPRQAQQFLAECAKRGAGGTPSQLLHRLLRLRKAADPEIRLPKTTARDNRDPAPFLVAAELASAQVGYRFGASIDDMLAEPDIGGYFDELAARIKPGSGALDCRNAALYLRKNIRAASESESAALQHLGDIDLGSMWQPISTLASLNADALPASPGIFALREPNRFLYLAQQKSVRSAAAFFAQGSALAAIANRFWTPDPRRIDIATISEDAAESCGLRLLELKALQVYHPLFNVPVAA